MPTTENIKFLIDILYHSPLATAIYVGPDIRFAFVNHEMRKVFGTHENYIGKPFGESFPILKEQGFSKILENVWRTGITYKATNFPARILNTDLNHTRFFDFEYKALLNENNETYAILHTGIEVTERNIALQTIKTHEQNLSLNNELELITHTLAHDAKNPLSIAKIGIETIKANAQMNQIERNNWLTIIDEAILSLNQIIDKTTQISEAKTFKISKETIYMDEKIHFWIKESKLINKVDNVNVIFGELLPLYSERSGVYQIFANIIGNAIKYSSVNINPTLTIFSEKQNDEIVYTIEDNGIGIPKDEIDKIFSNLQRGSNTLDHQGNGIDLYIVKSIINRLDGRIEIASNLGEGTRVKIYFPDHKPMDKEY